MDLTFQCLPRRSLFALLLLSGALSTMYYWFWFANSGQWAQGSEVVHLQQAKREVHPDRNVTDWVKLKPEMDGKVHPSRNFPDPVPVKLKPETDGKVHPDRNFTDWVKLKPEMDDPNWVEFVRKNYVVPPSDKPYKLSANVPKNPSAGQVQAVLQFLPSKSSGYFVECGALDGEDMSNTLYFEKELGWTGLLIEAGSDSYRKLVARNRKAWQSPVCLSMERYPVMGKFYENADGMSNSLTAKYPTSIPTEKTCVPLYTLLLAVNRTVIDFFSLDVELSEQFILNTIPFDKVIFKVITLEVGDDVRQQPIKEFLVSKGYIFYRRIRTQKAADFIFIYGGGNQTTPPSVKPG